MTIDAELATLGVVVVDERVLRRIIKRDRNLPGVGLQVPHAHCYSLPRDSLRTLVDTREIAVDLATLPERVIVIHGSRGALAGDHPEAQTSAWRAIFHARVHHAFDEQLAAGTLTATAIRERINRIGQTEFDEIRLVLRSEHLLLPPGDDTGMYIEFVALYLELLQFAPRALERTFPALHDTGHVAQLIARDLDVPALLAASRPPRAPAAPALEPTGAPAEPDSAPALSNPFVDPSAIPAADRARRKGNRARAAMLAYRAGEPQTARGDLDALVARLASALSSTETETGGWAIALASVARFAAAQRVLRFTAGARLLHDLQSACVAAEREDKVVDAVTWALSGGKRSIVRPLPAAREVRIAKHLHAAAKKLPECKLATSHDRELLAHAVHAMVERADHNVRATLRPKIEAALDTVGLQPANLPERVAQRKVVDELLDQAVAVGRLSLGNLRDALSHNDLKMPDLRPVELLGSDQLLRADHLLSISLDGVYRRGEIYLRFFQKLSSVLFGTNLGRLLSLYVLLPMIGAYVLIMGTQHVVLGLIVKHVVGFEPEILENDHMPEALAQPRLLGTAAFLFLLLHVPPFRRAFFWLMRTLGYGVKLAALAGLKLLASPLGRWVIRPAIPALIAFALAGSWQWFVAPVVLLLAEAGTNSRGGRLVEEILTDAAVRWSRQLGTRILPGVIKYLLDVFAELVELIERGIYRVDERLRFKTGQSKLTLVIKGVLGTLWFVVAYFLRLYVNLFVEPVINPIKHFPTVTVAAKLMIPFLHPMTEAIGAPLVPLLGPGLGRAFAGFTVFVIPGLAGFLVWELKENYKLYRKTRPAELHEVIIGHHGETMVAFMKPGFHSGTIPKLFGKLRRATWAGDDHGVARHKEALHHVEEAIEKFADRELVALLDEATPFKPTDVVVDQVELGSNRVSISLACPSVGPDAMIIVLEQQSGWLVANVPQRGWVDRLDDSQRHMVEIALAGFYKLAGVDLVREQLEWLLRDSADRVPPYDIADEGLIVWPGGGYETEAIYGLRIGNLAPVVRGAPLATRLPSLTGMHAVFRAEPLPWAVWTRIWENLVAGVEPPKLVGPNLLWARQPIAAVAA